MRIGVDIRALMDGKTTGVQTYLLNLLHHIFETDRRNQYILFANSFQGIDLPDFNYPNVSVKISRYPNKLFNLAQKIGFPRIESILGPIDLFFSPHWRTITLGRKTPLVATFHDLSFESMPEFFTWRSRLWHWFMDYQGAAQRADKIIAVSESTKEDLVKLYGVEQNKIDVVYPGVRPHPQPLSRPGEGGPPTGGPGEVENYFLYFGTFEPRKNIETVLAAYEHYLKRSKVKRKLVLAGSSGWKTKMHISGELQDSVTVKQNVTDEQKSAFFQNAFGFLFPSFYEGFGFPVLEAAAARVPVIASFSSSLAEVGADFSLFVNPLRPEQMGELMLVLENDDRLYDELQKKGIAAAKSFSWQRTAEKTLTIFNAYRN